MKQAARQGLLLIVIIPVPGVEDHPAQAHLKCPQPGRQFPVRHPVQGENIDENPAVVPGPGVLLVVPGGAAIPDLGVAPEIIFLRVDRLQLQPLPQLPGGHLHKPLVILPQHGQVDVVVPGDVALVPHRPDEGAAVGKIPQPVFPADPLHLVQHGQLHRPHPLHLLRHRESAAHFLPVKFSLLHVHPPPRLNLSRIISKYPAKLPQHRLIPQD